MNIVRVGIPSMPPLETVLEPSVTKRICFARFLDPFIQLLATVGLSLIMASLYVVNYACRMLTASQVVFFRLIYKPAFDPSQSSFKEMIDNYEEQIPPLMERVSYLEQRFWQDHLISYDMKEL